jgi:hypothetical protein
MFTPGKDVDDISRLLMPKLCWQAEAPANTEAEE